MGSPRGTRGGQRGFPAHHGHSHRGARGDSGGRGGLFGKAWVPGLWTQALARRNAVFSVKLETVSCNKPYLLLRTFSTKLLSPVLALVLLLVALELLCVQEVRRKSAREHQQYLRCVRPARREKPVSS